jgi:hypothetical protein
VICKVTSSHGTRLSLADHQGFTGRFNTEIRLRRYNTASDAMPERSNGRFRGSGILLIVTVPETASPGPITVPGVGYESNLLSHWLGNSKQDIDA